MTEPFADPIDWLLAGDPSIRWQVLRDLVGADHDRVAVERQRVAVEGWGARLLAAQDPDGRWASTLYSPKWTSTTYTLLLLHWLGLPAGHPQALAGCRQLWEGSTFRDGGLTLAKSDRRPETCITAILVLLASSFRYSDERIDSAVRFLLAQQLDDGGWNCETVRSGSRHGSFHTSISTLDALLEYDRSAGSVPVEPAMQRGREFFGEHRLYRSHRTGAVVNPTRSPRNGISTSSAGSSISGPRVPRRTTGCATPSRSSGAPGAGMAPGPSNAAIPAGRGSGWRLGDRAGGPPCGACECFAGGTALRCSGEGCRNGTHPGRSPGTESSAAASRSLVGRAGRGVGRGSICVCTVLSGSAVMIADSTLSATACP